MTLRSGLKSRWAIAALALVILLTCPSLVAQGPLPDAPIPSAATSPTPLIPVAQPKYEVTHKFWDTENRVLFAAVAASSGADFAVTRANLQGGGQELNPMVRVFGRSTAGLALNFAGETAGVIGCSYFLHKTHHHRMERAISMINIGGSLGAVVYGLRHR